MRKKNTLRAVLLLALSLLSPFLCAAPYTAKCAPTDSIPLPPPDFTHLNALWIRSSAALADTACGREIAQELAQLFHAQPITLELPTLSGLKDLMAEDGRLRLLTWTHALPTSGETLYKGIALHLDATDSLHITSLHDRLLPVGAGHIEEAWFNTPASPEKWFGAVYYEVQPFDFQGTPAYLLLGVAGRTELCTRKVIESLYIDATGELQFGIPCLSYSPRRTFHRIFYSYSSRVAMTLHFIKEGSQVLIDHLAPSAPQYAGLPQFYGPDASQDAFTRTEVGYWRHEADIIVSAPIDSVTTTPLRYRKGY